jgi:hypothetical protein
MITVTEISTADKVEWAPLLDTLTKEHDGDLITIEVLDPTYGDLHEAEGLPFAYCSYDRRDDVVVVAVGGASSRYPVVLRHMISRPTEVSVSGTAARVIDANGTATVVSFFPPATAS